MPKFVAIFSILFYLGCSSLDKPNFDYCLKTSTVCDSRTFESNKVRVITDLQRTGLNLSITNKTDKTIKLNPDLSVLVTMDGRSMRLINGETSFANRSGAQLPIVIPSGASIQKTFMVAEQIIVTQNAVGAADIMPGFAFDKKDYSGREFRLLLSFIDSGNQPFEENLGFAITGPAKRQK